MFTTCWAMGDCNIFWFEYFSFHCMSVLVLLNVRIIGNCVCFVLFFRHNSSLVCMVGITCIYVDTIFAFYGYILYTHLYC